MIHTWRLGINYLIELLWNNLHVTTVCAKLPGIWSLAVRLPRPPSLGDVCGKLQEGHEDSGVDLNSWTSGSDEPWPCTASFSFYGIWTKNPFKGHLVYKDAARVQQLKDSSVISTRPWKLPRTGIDHIAHRPCGLL